ncbi:glycosyltransferase family 4 protein [Deinococcus apachensis]|uniref:glycosyltransferase family 4 protein n=1 Tax=Deinococcus apachensis TaxID=309886 RepID=UPI00038023B4|nr:glycosyltransferase family 4 protein [Deinococcus apachensis]
MKILHVVGAIRLPPHPEVEGCSGVARATLELARAQVEQGHEVWIAVVGKGAWREVWRGVHLVQLPHRPWAKGRVGGRTLDFSVHLPYIALTRREHFDVIHGHMYPYLRFLRGRARVTHFHSDPGGISVPDLQLILRHSDAQIGVSAFVTEGLRRRLPGVGSIHTVYNGVDLATFDSGRWQDERRRLRAEWGLGEDDVAFLFAGAIVPEKGVLELGRAFAHLSATEPRVHLVLAGDAGLWDLTVRPHEGAQAYHAEVLRELGQVRPPGQVHALGRVSARDMGAVHAACDVLTVPSYTETFSLSALESMASGRPVIASAVGGLPEVVGLGAGLLVPPGDERALEEAMRRLARDRQTRLALGQRACERVRHLSWDAAARSLEAIYAQHLGG